MQDLIGSMVLYRNPLDHIQNAIRSFLDTRLDVQLYVIDNSPHDEARRLCQDPRVTYVSNQRNLGFGTAHNIALRTSLGKTSYHLVMNPDVYFDSGVLEKLLAFAESRPEVGLLMPKILSPEGETQYLCKLLPTPNDLILRRFLPGIFKPLFRDRLRRYEMRDRDYTKTMSVPVLSGCFMMINSSALAEVGLFDERYFMYLEDVDLCRRIGQQFETLYFPEAAIYHHHGKGSYRNARLLIQHVRSALQYFGKWGWFSDSERAHINGQEPARRVTLEATDRS